MEENLVENQAQNASEVPENVFEKKTVVGLEVPKKLPYPLYMFAGMVEHRYQPTLLNAVFPPFTAHVSNVTFDYIDGAEIELQSMVHLTVASASSGKGRVIDPAVDVITEDMVAEDEISRKKLEEWSKTCNTKGSNKDKPERPEDAYISMPMADFTNASLVQILKDAQRAGNKAIYNNLPEIELLNQVKTKNTSVDRVICLNFDNKIMGQERATAAGISGGGVLRWDMNVSTVNETARSFFKYSLLKGVPGRLSVSIIPYNDDDDEVVPKFKKYTDSFRKKLRPFIQNLKAASGKVRCKKIEATMLDLMKEVKEDMKLLDNREDREAYSQLAYRSIVIAMRKAYILYIGSGMKWTKEMDEFIRWSQKYCLGCSLEIWGDMMLSKLSEQKVENPFDARFTIREDFQELPDEFTCEDIVKLREAKGKKTSNVHVITKRWREKEWIEKIGENKFRKLVTLQLQKQ